MARRAKKATGDRLFWIVREHEGARSYFLQPAAESIFAQLKSAIAGHEGGKPVEVSEIDPESARKVPKDMIGRVLSEREVRKLMRLIK
jgi:hypothetical protein